MNDKAGIAANQDYGRDEDAAVKALKKHKVCIASPIYNWYMYIVYDYMENSQNLRKCHVKL